MLCCAMGVAAVATGAIGWRGFRRYLWTRLNTRSLLAAAAALMVALTITGLTLDHLVHHPAHANQGDTALLGEPSALPLCRGRAQDNRTTDIASIEE